MEIERIETNNSPNMSSDTMLSYQRSRKLKLSRNWLTRYNQFNKYTHSTRQQTYRVCKEIWKVKQDATCLSAFSNQLDSNQLLQLLAKPHCSLEQEQEPRHAARCIICNFKLNGKRIDLLTTFTSGRSSHTRSDASVKLSKLNSGIR